MKGVKIFAASFLALLLCSGSASALSASTLERVSEDSEFIEILEPEEDYDFDVNFLAKDQELQYKATITNDEELPVKIDSISLNESEYDFLEYSYDGVSVGDVIEVGETKDIFVTVKTNENDTSTVSEDYNLTLTYTQVKPEPQPGPEPTPDDPDTPDTPDEPENPATATTAVIKTGTIALISIGAIVFVFVRNKRIRQYAIVFTLSSLGIFMFASSATAEEAASTLMIYGKVRFTNVYTVTVDPNGGTYNGELTATRREGETYHIEEVSRNHFAFDEWEINPSNTPDANNNIEIHANTTLKAKWNENTYTLTIKPNGGEYLDSEEDWHQSYRPGQSETIATPEKEGYNFVNWTVEKGADTVGEDGIFTGDSVTMYEDVTLVANYEIKKFTVTIIPNGGTYEGELQTTVDWNTDYEILSISKDGNDLKDWTKTVGETSSTLASDTEYVNIQADTTLEANWWSSAFYTVTIVPNGGTYAGDLETQVRAGQTYTMQDISHDNAIFDYWHYTDTDTHMDDSEFVVNDNISLTAEWLPIVAKIVRTNVVYPSIMAAHEEAESGDTIELLVDTTEIVTNEKNITLDLGNHTVTGSLTNTENGELVLINGEIDNPNGSAVTNNGTLTMGINDYDDEEVANVVRDYVRLVGTDIGLRQNAVFNYYDGYIEGDIGLYEGYNDSPLYRRAYDGVEVKFFPFVSNIGTDGNYRQHVELQPADRAVTKTIDKGEIYYYKIQDNVDASVVTGYDIYAVRNFVSTSPVTIPANSEIVFDVAGFDVSLEDDWVNNGTLTIKDSKTGDEAGEMNFDRSITNNSDLTLSNVHLVSASGNVLMYNNKDLTMTNSIVETSGGAAIRVDVANASYAADNTSYVLTTGNSPAIDVYAQNFEVLSGNVKTTSSNNYGYALRVNSGSSAVIKGGTVEGTSSAHAVYAGGTLTVQDNGKVKSYGTAIECGYGVKIYVKGGEIIADARGKNSGATAIYSCDADISGGDIKAYSSSSGTTYGVYSGAMDISGGTLYAEATGTGGAQAWYGHYDTATITGGTLTAKTNSGTAVAINGYSSSASMSGGKLIARTTSGVANGVTDLRNGFRITGGEIDSDTYGISNVDTTIGVIDVPVATDYPLIQGGTYAINGGSTYFYDGLLKGGQNATTQNAIKGVPDGYAQHIEKIDGVENDWLAEGVRYLMVNGIRYSSMAEAYSKVENNGTVYVVEDATVEGVLPANPSGKTITLDLGGHTLNVSQPIVNKGTMTIIDDSTTGKNGTVKSTSSSVLYNEGQLNVTAGEFYSNSTTLETRGSSSRVDITGGLIDVKNGSKAIYINQGKVVQSGGVVSASGDANYSTWFTAVDCYSSSSYELNTGGKLEVSSSYPSQTIRAIESCSTTMKGGEIDARTEGSIVVMYQNTFDIQGGTVYAKGDKGAELTYLHNSKGTISGGSTEIYSINGKAHGFYNGYNSSASMSGGLLYVHSDTQESYGATNLNFEITGGTVRAGTYAYDAGGRTITIGNNSNAVVTDNPRLEGGVYALNGGTANFYDGTLVGGTAADVQNSSDVIKAIPDGYVRHTETVEGRTTSWLVKDTDYLEVLEPITLNSLGEYSSMTEAYSVVPDGGTVRVIEDKTTTASLPANPAGKTITFDLNDHAVTFSQPLVNNGTMTIVDNGNDKKGELVNTNTSNNSFAVENYGILTVESGKITASKSAIKTQKVNTTNAKLYITGGEVKSTGDTYTIYNLSYTEISGGKVISKKTGVECSGGSLDIKGDAQIIADAENANNYVEAVHFCTTEMTGGSVLAKSISGGSAVAFSQNQVSVTGGTVDVISNSVATFAYVQYARATIGGTADVDVKATGSSGDAYGFQYMYNAYFTMTGGSLNVESANGIAYGAKGFYGDNIVTGGTITSDDYGIYSCDVRIGDNTNAITTTPTIIGGQYAVFGGSVNFYDGTLKGGIAANYDRNIKNIATDAAIVLSRETIDGKEYEVKTLQGERPIVRIGSTPYNSIAKAYAKAEDGDEIVLTEDNYVFENLQFNRNIAVTVNLDDHTIVTGNVITVSSGDVTIKNPATSSRQLIDYRESSNFITVNSGASLTLSNVEIKHTNTNQYAVLNNGSTTIDNSKIQTSGSAIGQNGTKLEVKNSIIDASNYAVSVNGNTGADIDGSTLTGGSRAIVHGYNTGTNAKTTVDKSTLTGEVDIQVGEISFGADSQDGQVDSTINVSRTDTSGRVAILSVSSGAKATLKNAEINGTLTRHSSNSDYHDLINNNGTLTLTNTDVSVDVISSSLNINVLKNSNKATITNSDVTFTCTSCSNSYSVNGINMTGGELSYASGTISVNHGTARGINLSNGTVTLLDSEVYATGVTAIGADVSNGELTMGVAESPSSPTYETENADVSTESPVISGIGTNSGIGVQKGNGRFDFYDGVIIGSTNALPVQPTQTESHYEVKITTESDGYSHAVLDYIRNPLGN